VDTYLTATDLAARLQVSPSTLYRWAARDVTMPVLRLGPGVVRFPAEALEKWLAARTSRRRAK